MGIIYTAMRLANDARPDLEEIDALAYALDGLAPERVALFGSRVEPDRRGGDVDLLILSDAPAYKLSKRVATRFFSRCEEKIDVVVLSARARRHARAAGISRFDQERRTRVNRQILLSASKDKLAAALEFLFASVDAYVPFDPARRYTPKEREPYDALTDRYLSAFESSLKFFRTLERDREVTPSESFRDLLLRMEKYGAITGAALWIEMRDTRNRVAHEYLPEELARIYADVIGPAATELRYVLGQSSVQL